jgi:hypothetical protein
MSAKISNLMGVFVIFLLIISSRMYAQTHIDVESCSWIQIQTSMGPDGLPVNNYLFSGNSPDDYFLIYSDSSQSELLMEGEMAGGMQQGEWSYYSGGVMTESVTYFNSIRSGLYQAYFSNGAVRVRAHFVNGEVNGDYFVYDEMGNIVTNTRMENGIPVAE